MIFYQQRRNNNKKVFFIAIFIIAFLLIIIEKVGFVSKNLSQVATSVATPLWKTESYILEQGGIYAMKLNSKEDLIRENKNLREDIALLQAGSLSKERILQENKELKEHLGRYDIEPRSVLSAVLVKPNRSVYDTLIIDVGYSDAVQVGSKVTAYGDVTIGVVEKVYSRTSLVKLFSSPGEDLSVLVGEENIAAIAVGLGGGNFSIELPRGVDVEEGGLISFPSISTSIAGVIELIQVHPSDSFQTILFKSPVNMYQLKWVEVLIGD